VSLGRDFPEVPELDTTLKVKIVTCTVAVVVLVGLVDQQVITHTMDYMLETVDLVPPTIF
jgi:hypothetical protein